MPAPLDIRPNGGGAAPVASFDAQGNETIVGNLTITNGVVYLGKVSAAPTPIPGAIALYTLDGVTLQYVAAGGQSPNVSIGGTLAVTGRTTLGDMLVINSADAAGSININQTVPTTTNPGTISDIESAATNGAYGVRVTGDAHTRFNIAADGSMKWGDGTNNQDAFLARSAAGVLSLTSTSLDVATAGRGLRVAEGSNAKQGTSVLVAGSVVVANTSVTATSRIFLTSQADGGTPGFLRVSTRTAGTSFTITSSSGTDTSTVAWEIFEVG